jgi:fatty acid CoA ligase FadD9
VDWLIDAGPIQRIPGYDAWLAVRHGIACTADNSRLTPAAAANYQRRRSRSGADGAPIGSGAVQEAKIGPDKDIPHVTAPVIVKYITDLQLLGLL